MIWLLLSCAGVLLGAWLAARPMPGLWRWGFLFCVTLLLVGMTLPPEWVRLGVGWLSQYLPVCLASESSPVTEHGSATAHLLLFAVVSAWLTWWRADLGIGVLLPALVALSLLTEGLQLLVDGRYASWGDVGLNLLGSAFGLLLWPLAARCHPSSLLS